MEDDAPYRSALRDLLAVEREFVVEGAYDAAVAFLAAARGAYEAQRSCPWDLVLMDIDLPRLDGIEAIARPRAMWPEAQVVMLTAFEDPQGILGAICAGAIGYLLKKSNAAEVLDEVRAVLQGGSPLTPSVARSILSVLRRGAPAPVSRTVSWEMQVHSATEAIGRAIRAGIV